MNIRKLTRIAVLVALVCVSSYIAIPLPFTPTLLTLQTIFINLIALMLTPKESAAAIGLYVLLGVCGLPVFSGGTGGIGRLLGPGGGFLVGFLIAVPMISWAKGTVPSMKRYLLATIFVGLPIIFLCATIFMCYFGHTTVLASMAAVVAPFVIGDVIKCVAASYLATVLVRILPQSGVRDI